MCHASILVGYIYGDSHTVVRCVADVAYWFKVGVGLHEG